MNELLITFDQSTQPSVRITNGVWWSIYPLAPEIKIYKIELRPHASFVREPNSKGEKIFFNWLRENWTFVIRFSMCENNCSEFSGSVRVLVVRQIGCQFSAAVIKVSRAPTPLNKIAALLIEARAHTKNHLWRRESEDCIAATLLLRFKFMATRLFKRGGERLASVWLRLRPHYINALWRIARACMRQESLSFVPTAGNDCIINQSLWWRKNAFLDKWVNSFCAGSDAKGCFKIHFTTEADTKILPSTTLYYTNQSVIF